MFSIKERKKKENDILIQKRTKLITFTKAWFYKFHNFKCYTNTCIIITYVQFVILKNLT